MTLEEIFKDKPELLETKEVQNLIEYVQGIQVKNAEIARRVQKQSFEINDVIMYSNRVLIKGYSDTVAINKIEEIINW